MLDMGEACLPSASPLGPGDPARRRAVTGRSAGGRSPVPDPALEMVDPPEFQDNLHMLTLFRGGPVMWIRRRTPSRSRSGQRLARGSQLPRRRLCRAAVSVRVPEGIALLPLWDRHVNVPISEVTGQRGGTDNSLTRISMKPTHMIGGYAQLSYGFNYYGPCGTQRDQLIIIRKRQEEVRYQ